MKTEKNIDNLFNEKLSNFEVVPDTKIWDNIEKELDKKDKIKKGTPFWLFGAVASLAILISVFTLTNTKTEHPDSPQIEIVDIKNTLKQNDHTVITKSKKGINTPLSNKTLINTENSPKKVEAIVYSTQQKNNSTPKKQPTNYIKNNTLHKRDNSVRNDSNEIQLAATKSLKKERNSDTKNTTNPDKKAIINTKKTTPNSNKIQLADLNKPSQDFKDIEKKNSKWFVQPTIGAIVSQEDSFVAYGVKFGVKLNKRLSIQSGICTQEMSPQGNLNNTMAYSNSSTNVDPSAGNGRSIKETIIEDTFSYVEVPFEMKYKIFKINNFSTDLLAGGSSYFLIKNTAPVNYKSTEKESFKSIKFSTNLGVGFNYKIYKSLNIYLNPVFKKTLGPSDENFNNYQLGVYTGLKYEF